MCDQCNELYGDIRTLNEKLLSETAIRGLYEGKTQVLEKQVSSQQTTISTLLEMIKKDK